MEFFKKRSPSFWVIMALTLGSVFLFAMGFRITYFPTLENSFAAIGAAADWVSALGTIAAVVVAVIIANRQNEIAKKQNAIAKQQAEIAEQQNRIALFEKRFEFYNVVQTCTGIGNLLSNAKDAEAAVSLVAESFNKGNYLSHIINDKNADYIKVLAIDAYDRVYEIMEKAEFIFEFETVEYLCPLVNFLLEIVTMRGNDREQRYHRFVFTQYSDKIDKELLPHIEESLMQMKR